MKKILIIGSGYMAIEYLKVLKFLKTPVIVVSRSKKNKSHIMNSFQNVIQYHDKGLASFNGNGIQNIDFTINCVSIENLFKTTIQLMNLGLKKILVEKPGCLSENELNQLIHCQEKSNSRVYIAMNRRFYNSTIELKNQLKKLNIFSAKFDFTERIHFIENNNYPKEVLKKWVYSNSIHLIDLFFFIMGDYKSMNTKIFGIKNKKWHESSSIFIGDGIIKNGIPFSYITDWNSPGRWGITINTNKKQFILSPLEELKFMSPTSFEIYNYNFKDDNDEKFKPGLYKMINSFMNNNFENFQTLINHKGLFKTMNKISGY